MTYTSDIILILILFSIFVEAITQLIFTAAPLQPIKNYIRSRTPMLYSKEREEHLLDCKYCTSTWVSMISIVIYYLLWPNVFLTIVFYGCIIHRISNYMHTIYSYMHDKQINLRIARR